mmetsp:Transcript_64878/g.130408  ORF Transcript_64878/g.130408 Transcript_64878/m.130408 type:complete len:181 (-) Transcript_64878:265-807(-)
MRASTCGVRIVTLAAALAAVGAECPGSKALIHAKARVRLRVLASCSDAMAEMKARVNGQYDLWHDPHNNGTYRLLRSDPSGLEFSRVTGNKKYTDLLTFTFRRMGGDACYVSGCSESQVFSIKDFSTNFCNLYNLYCGTAEGCHPVAHDLKSNEIKVWKSLGAGKDKGECLKVQQRLLLL